MKVIEGKFRVVGEEPPPRPPHWLVRLFLYVIRQPLFWWWAFALTVLALTEGLL